MIKGGAGFFLATSLLALTEAAQSSETVTYSYDSLGRLTKVARSGTVNNGVTADYSYDASDNRTNVTVAAGSPPPPPPPPPPPAGNQPPTAVADSVGVMACIPTNIPVLTNDTDPDGNVPLTLLAVTQGTKGTASVGLREKVAYTPGNQTGTDVLTYTVRDSLGASATGTLTLTITVGQC
ncbi:MAG: Ig-like domain-containing protein [Allosphingosinicella sp.]